MRPLGSASHKRYHSDICEFLLNTCVPCPCYVNQQTQDCSFTPPLIPLIYRPNGRADYSLVKSIQESSYEYGFDRFVRNATVMSFVCDFRQNQWTQKFVLTTLDSTVLCSTVDAATKQNLYTNIYIIVLMIIIDLSTLLSIYMLGNLHLSQIIIII